MRCSSCNAKINPDDQFCGDCGEKNFPPIPSCPGCSTEFQEGDQFCGVCGQALTSKKPKTVGDEIPKGFQPKAFPPLLDKKKSIGSRIVFRIVLVIIGLLVAFYFFFWQPDKGSRKEKAWFPQPPKFQPEIPKERGFKDLSESSDADSPNDFNGLLKKLLEDAIEEKYAISID